MAGAGSSGGEDAGDLAIVPCVNLPNNGAVTRRALMRLAELAGATAVHAHLAEHVAFVSTSIDRITPKTTPADLAAVADATGWNDRVPVVTP